MPVRDIPSTEARIIKKTGVFFSILRAMGVPPHHEKIYYIQIIS
jgi:hypothetical protein